MERKRKLPARGARAEPASKKRAPSDTPDEPRQTSTPIPTPPVQEESLPKSIAPGKPLPTLEVPQPENLSSKEFQTVSESGVLTDSLHRSRQKWLSEGIFEKFWTKPVKKKGVPEQPPNNPPKDSMTKLGSCTITVEPHIFEATISSCSATSHPTAYVSPYNTIWPSEWNDASPHRQYPPPTPAKQFPMQQTAQAPPRAHDTPMKIESPTPNKANPQAPLEPNGSLQTLQNGQATAHPPPSGPPNNPQPPNTPAPAEPADKSKDPVIQMLAERASTDPDLKALMRIVANGQASADELKRFQSHIDDLTRLQKSRQAPTQPNPPLNQPPPSPAVPKVNGQPQGRPPAQSPTPAPPPAVRTPAPAHSPAPSYQSQPQALRSKGPLPSKPDISGVVFEFTGGTGDRYLFPKFSILEYLPQGQVIASFLIVRKGSTSDSPAYDPALDYYQPITIRLYAHQGRQLEALQKIVAPADEVRRYMDDIMDNMTRAEYVLLAMRLPKETEQPSPEKESSTENIEQVDNQVLWATTNPTPAAVVKPAKRLLTEEEKYQGFITSVAAAPT
ncbi:hypothetical protein LHYA1_G005174 [Lachnellula hyalina]|uniref:SWR1-complex protein 3 domain-containing protein n=1 Tax=Lachnellula hyalina TaxID=1316788 RepID=A0A8H8R449_9HELO|nr:uncharacterized protein LHYA1_G005174 [Lachnellula hyalina]TVY28013.1 hypothetical protein LHYA1_G005174 [Lachnellula hyalina]